MICRVLFAIALVAVPAWGYGAGAPLDVCGDMTPQHHVQPQKSPSPYTVRVSSTQIRSGEPVTVDIKGNSASDTIKGFFAEARSNGQIVGTFQVDPQDPHVQTRNCPPGQSNAVTHKKILSPPNSIRLVWVPPQGFTGTVQILATVALNGGVFWVNKTFGEIAVV